jgi:hypothetical protein
MCLYNIHVYIQSINTTTSDQSNMQDTSTCFGLVNGPSSGCSQNFMKRVYTRRGEYMGDEISSYIIVRGANTGYQRFIYV